MLGHIHTDLAALESEQRYKRLLGSVTDYICTVKLDNGCPVETTHGPGCEAVTGYPPGAFSADPYLWFRMIVPEDRDMVLTHIARVESGEAVPSLEHRILHKDGSIRWIKNTPVLHRDEDGRVTSYDGLISDITERKWAEEAHRLSYQQYESLVNGIDGIVWECDVRSGRPTFISPQAIRLLGYQPELWLREPDFWEHRLNPEDRERTLALFAQLSAERPTQVVEYRMRAADGRTVWIRDLVRLVVQNGRGTKLCGVMMDITGRKLAEEALQKNHLLLQAISEGTTDAVFVKDLQGRYLTINTAGARLLGKRVEEVIGKDDTELFSPDTARAIMEGDRLVRATGETQTYEDVGTAAGVTRTYLSTKGPYRDVRGNVIGLIGISCDITARKLADRRLLAEHAVTRVLSESADLQVATPKILQALCEGLGWDVADLWEVDRQGTALRCVAVWHVADVEVACFERLSRESTFAPGQGLPGRVWSGEEPSRVRCIAADPAFPRWAIAEQEGLRAALAFPLRGGKDFLGVLEFFSREIREPDETLIAMMDSISSQISQFIEHRQAEKALHQRQRELWLARQIQQGLFPRTAPSLAGFEMGGACRPAQETGGDYYDFLPLPDGRLGITIGDASGKGVAAALLMAETRAYLHALSTSHAEVGQILCLTNQHLVEDIERDWFVTLFFASLDPKTRELIYSSGGHCPGYVLDRQGDVKHILKCGGYPLGIIETAEYEVAEPIKLEPGDILFLYTDGIVGALSPSRVVFTIEDALNLIRTHRDEPVPSILEALEQAVHTHCGAIPFDDMTAIILKVVEGST